MNQDRLHEFMEARLLKLLEVIRGTELPHSLSSLGAEYARATGEHLSSGQVLFAMRHLAGRGLARQDACRKWLAFPSAAEVRLCLASGVAELDPVPVEDEDLHEVFLRVADGRLPLTLVQASGDAPCEGPPPGEIEAGLLESAWASRTLHAYQQQAGDDAMLASAALHLPQWRAQIADAIGRVVASRAHAASASGGDHGVDGLQREGLPCPGEEAAACGDLPDAP